MRTERTWNDRPDDFTVWSGGEYLGREYKEAHGSQAGLWQWNANVLRTGNSGWAERRQEACEAVWGCFG